MGDFFPRGETCPASQRPLPALAQKGPVTAGSGPSEGAGKRLFQLERVVPRSCPALMASAGAVRVLPAPVNEPRASVFGRCGQHVAARGAPSAWGWN